MPGGAREALALRAGAAAPPAPEVDAEALFGLSFDGRRGKAVAEQVEAVAAASIVLGQWAGDRAVTSAGRIANQVTFWMARDAAELVFVDVDPCLAPVADAFLAPARRRGRYAAMDGRAYLLRHAGAFDAIVLDAYADRTATPAHLLTREFFALARSRLAEDGTLYVNLIVAP